MVENDIDPNSDSSLQRCSHVDISSKYQYVTGDYKFDHPSPYASSLLDKKVKLLNSSLTRKTKIKPQGDILDELLCGFGK